MRKGQIIWKEIIGYEGLYKISNYGDIISYVVKKSGKKMKLTINNGYLVVNLKKNQIPKVFNVHRLVAQTFLPKIDGKDTVNHIDGSRNNNYVGNLEWCTQKENVNHAFKIGAYDFHRKPVLQYDKNFNLINTFTSATEAGLSLKSTKNKNSKISFCAKGKRKTAYGFIWKYLNELPANI